MAIFLAENGAVVPNIMHHTSNTTQTEVRVRILTCVYMLLLILNFVDLFFDMLLVLCFIVCGTALPVHC